VMLFGNGRGFLTALITGEVQRMDIQDALDALNMEQPHYKQVRAFHLCREAFTIENGLLTANGKFKRDAIHARFRAEIEALYPASRAAQQ
jgi:long-chain acyl-CoA synthetase